jgi:hypothetical protein
MCALWCALQSGPAVYFLSEVTHRLLRYRDDDYKWIRQQGLDDICK